MESHCISRQLIHEALYYLPISLCKVPCLVRAVKVKAISDSLHMHWSFHLHSCQLSLVEAKYHACLSRASGEVGILSYVMLLPPLLQFGLYPMNALGQNKENWQADTNRRFMENVKRSSRLFVPHSLMQALDIEEVTHWEDIFVHSCWIADALGMHLPIFIYHWSNILHCKAALKVLWERLQIQLHTYNTRLKSRISFITLPYKKPYDA